MDPFDKIRTSAPVNREAALSISGKGESWEPSGGPARQTFVGPPRMKPVPRDAPNHGGLVVGRFTVIGMAADHNKRKGGRWVCRCVCGNYELRRTAALVNPENAADCCDPCRKLLRVQKLGGQTKEGREIAKRWTPSGRGGV